MNGGWFGVEAAVMDTRTGVIVLRDELDEAYTFAATLTRLGVKP